MLIAIRAEVESADRGLAKDSLRSFWEESQKRKLTKLFGGTSII